MVTAHVRYIIYGAGAVGGSIGARLFENGHDVTFIARGDHGRALAARGLRFGTPHGWRTLAIPIVEHPRDLTFTPDDIVILGLKSQDTMAALDALAPCMDTGVPIVCAQNGVENERRALRRYANVHGMCVFMIASHNEPGVVFNNQLPASGICDIGRYPHGIDAIDRRIAEDFEAAGIRSQACADIMARKYAKLLLNLLNQLEAASGRRALASPLAQRARAEAEAAYAAAGIVAQAAPDDRALSLGDVPGVTRVGGSTMQSVARGATTLEVDDLNGEIVLLGRLHGVATPVNAMLQRVAVRMMAERLAAGSIPLAELERAV